MANGAAEPLTVALAELPPPGAQVATSVPPRRFEDGSISFPHVDNGRELRQFFRTFNSGAFGFAGRDRDYICALDDWEKRNELDPLDPASAACFDRETCLLVLRQVDRSERFCDGAWAAAHGSGLLHAVLGRLIEIERNGCEEKLDPGSSPG